MSKPQLNHKSTQPQFKITLVGLNTKMTVHTTPLTDPPHPHKFNISNISAVTDPILIKIDVGSWEHLEHIPTVTVTFVQVAFVLAISVHIRNISTVTDPILMKL